MQNTVSRKDVAAAALAAGIADRVACVHASLRSFGNVDGGAEAVVHGLLDVGTTLVVPTSTFQFCMAPRPDGLPQQPFNSDKDGSMPLSSEPSARFDTKADFVDPAMGAVPAVVLHLPGRVRGNHPLASFTAIGPLAREVIEGQTPSRVYAPLEAVIARRGVVVCMGVGLDTVTLLHLAELRAGLRLLRRWAWSADGTVVEAVHGGCSRGFERLAEAVRGAEKRHRVGDSTWRIFDAGWLLAAATKRFVADPAAGLCADPSCVRCTDQAAHALNRARVHEGMAANGLTPSLDSLG